MCKVTGATGRGYDGSSFWHQVPQTALLHQLHHMSTLRQMLYFGNETFLFVCVW